MRFLASTLCVLGMLFMGGESVAKDDPQLIDPKMCQTLAIQTRETSSNLTVLNSLMRDMRNPQVANEDLERHYEIMNGRYQDALSEMAQLSTIWRNYCAKSD